MYVRQTFYCNGSIQGRMRPMLHVKLRQLPHVVSATSEGNTVTIYCRKQADLSAIYQFIMAFVAKYGKEKEAVIEDTDMSSYRRDAMVSVAGFLALNLMKRFRPEWYASTLLVRRLFTLYIARRYIKTGISGLVQDHRANADTLTATAVFASVLAGKPESSLTLLALSNASKMMTAYAAEKTRRQISSLLKLD